MLNTIAAKLLFSFRSTVHLRYKMIICQNVSSVAQVKNFFIS